MALLAFAVFVPFASASSVGSGSQYVVYGVSASGPNRSVSATVNETVSPSSTSGMASVSLQVISNYANLSYSKLVNASQTLLPMIPSMGPMSFHTTIKNATISATVTQTGTQSISFAGASYTITNYSFNLSVQGANRSVSASGQYAVFPSGLAYSATATINGTSTVSAHLLSTNVPLNVTSGASGSTTTTMAVAGGGLSLLAGVGAFAFFRRERKKSNVGSETESKPLHWVD